MSTLTTKLLRVPDAWLNRVSMYRLVVYYLSGLLGIAVIQAALGRLDFQISAIVGTTAVAVLACIAINALFASVFDAPLNHDSAVITGLILALVTGPVMTRGDIIFVAWAGTLAMASKYILAIRNVHLFNPAAIALVITATFADQTASWWVSTTRMTPFVIAGGLLLVRKIRRGDLLSSFLWAALFVHFAANALDGVPFRQALDRGIVDSPVWFLGFVMLTEPVTLPPTKWLQMAYGVVAGVLVMPEFHVGAFYLTPELGLVIANACALPIRSLQKRQFVLDRAIYTGPGLMDFLYTPIPPLAYEPGQYMEWTLDHDRPDSRGKRRYFTLASSPTERNIRLGVKFTSTAEEASSFKRAMVEGIATGAPIVAGYVSGDFTLPRDRKQKLAFIAGGIGVTPFRGMVKYLTDSGQQRDVVMLYANRRFDEILYRDVFQAASRAFRFRSVYVLSDPTTAPYPWTGETGRIDLDLIADAIPDYRERLFYISGSQPLVESVLDALRQLGVNSNQIKTDYFSGLAA